MGRLLTGLQAERDDLALRVEQLTAEVETLRRENESLLADITGVGDAVPAPPAPAGGIEAPPARRRAAKKRAAPRGRSRKKR